MSINAGGPLRRTDDVPAEYRTLIIFGKMSSPVKSTMAETSAMLTTALAITLFNKITST